MTDLIWKPFKIWNRRYFSISNVENDFYLLKLWKKLFVYSLNNDSHTHPYEKKK